MIHCLALIAIFLGALTSRAALHGTQQYAGMCDASAAVALDAKRFVVADDEGNTLRVYERGVEKPVSEFSLSRFLLRSKKGAEADLEGGARIGDTIYWISSHGRDRDGKVAPHRRQFFAMRILGGGSVLDPIGRPYTRLLDDLLAEKRFEKFGFEAASKISPKEHGGLNIEGMSARADGSLLIAFRKPVPNGKALLLPLLNPEKVILGEKAVFGEIIALDLGGFGVRDIMFDGERYLIVAGHHQPGKDFRLFTWKGAGAAEAVDAINFGKLNPEALFHFPGDAPGRYQVLSDDGGRKINGKECKDLPPSQRSFRASEFTLPR